MAVPQLWSVLAMSNQDNYPRSKNSQLWAFWEWEKHLDYFLLYTPNLHEGGGIHIQILNAHLLRELQTTWSLAA